MPLLPYFLYMIYNIFGHTYFHPCPSPSNSCHRRPLCITAEAEMLSHSTSIVPQRWFCQDFDGWNSYCWDHTWGRDGSTVPFDFDVSGVPSPFLLFSGSLVMSVECLVSVLEIPSCFPDWTAWLPAGLDAAGYIVERWLVRFWCAFIQGTLQTWSCTLSPSCTVASSS